MKQYLEALQHIMANGNDREDRTGVGTRGVFGYQMRFNLQDGFPLLTTKKIHTKSIIHELLWFLKGDTNIKYLNDHGVTIWNEWANKDGELGPVYGKQWRDWNKIDQIADLISNLKSNPFSRRNIVTAWNPPMISQMKLPPCHTLWQCYVDKKNNGKYLSLHLYARSIDTFLGLPFNIASYALLLSMLACVTDMIVGELIISFGDLHIYNNHFDQVKEQLSRDIRSLPTLLLTKRQSIDDFQFEDFRFEGYNPHPAIKAPIAV